MKKIIFILIAVVLGLTSYGQTTMDTSKCYLLIFNKNGTNNFIYAYEVTKYNADLQQWDHVLYLKENGRRLRKKRVIFVESMR